MTGGPPRMRASPTGLGAVGDRRAFTFAGLKLTGRRRRPSGEPPPLPRELQASGAFWLAAAAFVVVVWGTLFMWPGASDFWGRWDGSILATVDGWRNAPATDAFVAVNWLTAEVLLRVTRIGILIVLVGYRRWRHLVAAVTAIALVQFISAQMATAIARPRPPLVPLAGWEGYSHPSLPVAGLAVTFCVAGYALVPEGRRRRAWFVAAGSVLAVTSFARVYLGVDHPTDAVAALLLGVGLTVLVFRLFVPSQVFPVSYRRHRAAHLDIDGSREQAIVTAMRDQLGVAVRSIRPIGLAGSAGSTPLLLSCDEGGEERLLFAKLCASSHMRADRWYKWGRLILYGSLEDEVRFTSVRRLIEYEDYVLRVMRDAAIPAPGPLGVVEITPEREYLLVTEFFAGAAEIGDVTLDDELIDQALGLVASMWDAGLAHRDIKPSNVMVDGGVVRLVDVSFAQVRPSPWRQAVDLANMMLTLGLGADPERVYAIAMRRFSPGEVAEAFAATHGVTIPTQTRRLLRQRIRDGGDDLVAIFRALAPSRQPIVVQRWSRRRLGVTAATAVAAVLLLLVIIDNLQGQGFI